MSAQDAQHSTEVPQGADDGPPPELWHKMYTGSDRYLCGRLRALRYRGLPSQGGAPGPRVQCPVCEVIYLNLMWTD